MVRTYTTQELLTKAKSLPTFNGFPNAYWILGIRSNEDAFDTFDDKFYIFQHTTHIATMSGTTHAGADGLLNFDKWKLSGSAVIKANEWYYEVWKRGLHKGKMVALIQIGAFKVIRDSDKNRKAGDSGKISLEQNKGLNFHTNTYNVLSTVVKKIIGLWSLGCQVSNEPPKYFKFLKDSTGQNYFTYCLLDEF